LLAEHRLWNAWIAVRATATVLEWTLEYVRARHVFGTSVASFENTRLVLAGVEADRRVAAAAVESLVAGLVSGGLDLDGAAAASHVAVEMFVRAADQGLQLHGGYGYMREYPISTAFADANLLQLRADATGPLDVLAGALGLDPDEVSGGRSRESA
jgi:acyl-CoA dehydrogenase